eukprot:CAMPEP_0119007062 /NCGR_PEP_ID=MMETSP1176-20130426/2742_1 /TAXON_ID=265551 /ORGANISM="Synedropsis recta cf, Strain CCMP1620" /LENGTH=359 /DNA_ID=CAMNT_0006959125 /DNA_START=351 /DNA_END=1430 /DNA_ORIENTATION=-
MFITIQLLLLAPSTDTTRESLTASSSLIAPFEDGDGESKTSSTTVKQQQQGLIADKASASETATATTAVLDLKGEALGDRSLPEASLDLHYTLHLNEFKNTMKDPTYDKVMTAFHTDNIWTEQEQHDSTTSTGNAEKSRLDTMLDLWNLRDGNQKNGSPILDHENRIDKFLLQTTNPPRVIVEVGVFRGANSIHLAQRLQQHAHLKDTFIICIDTWLLDLRYVWPPAQMTGDDTYFQSTRVAGHELMYFVFLANVLKANMQHRIIPLQSSSLNGALALIAKGIRPDLIYLDASHANPDVFLDLINFWTILQPGGVLVADDYKVALPVRAAVEAFQKRFPEEIAELVCPQNQCWIYKKMK